MVSANDEQDTDHLCRLGLGSIPATVTPTSIKPGMGIRVVRQIIAPTSSASLAVVLSTLDCNSGC